MEDDWQLGAGDSLRHERDVLTRFITPFGFHSTAAEVINGVNLASRRAIVTGGASGIGIETARALAGAGASVTLAVRRPDAAEPVAIELRRSTGNHAIDIRTLDLSDLRSVKSFTDAWEGPLHILVSVRRLLDSLESLVIRWGLR